MLLDLVSLVPQLLYDSDIVEEKAICEWAAKASRKYASREVAAEVRRRAQPFLDWLKEADEEESSDDGSEEDIEVGWCDMLTVLRMRLDDVFPRSIFCFEIKS